MAVCMSGCAAEYVVHLHDSVNLKPESSIMVIVRCFTACLMFDGVCCTASSTNGASRAAGHHKGCRNKLLEE